MNWSNLRLIVNYKKIQPVLFFYALSVLTFLVAAACNKSTINPVEKTFVLMDTYVTIRVYDNNRSRADILSAIDRAQQRMAEIESLTTTYEGNSEVIRINKQGAKKPLTIGDDVAKIVAQAQQTSEISQGAFDITVQPLMLLWGFGSAEHMRVPSKDSIEAQLSHVDFHKIHLTSQNIEKDDALTGIDLGGIAKGYAIDVATEMLERVGISDGQVDAGGNLRTLVSPLTAGKRHVYVRHPRQHEAFYGRFPMDAGAVATSGDYERFFFQDSIRYHHILDPKSGFPAKQCISATIKATTAMLCDALSTAVFVLGPEKGMELIERLPEVEGLIVFEKDGKLTHAVSSGLKNKFQLLENNF